MEVTGFGGRCEYTVDHIQLWLKVGPIASLARFHVVRIEVSYHVLLRRPWLHKHQLVQSTYHQCVKGRLNGRTIRIVANPSPFEQAEAHLVKLCSTINGLHLGKAQCRSHEVPSYLSGKTSEVTQSLI